MTQNFLNILFSALGVIVTGLASFALAKFTQWINNRISDNKIAGYITAISNIVFNCVQEVSQTYVDDLKKSGSFDKEAQKAALDKCLAKIKSQMAPELMTYISNTFGDVNEYLVSLVESTIHSTKG